METNRPTITPQGFIGVFIVLLGIVFTLDNLGLVESREVLQYWPLAPLGIGLLIVIHANETRDWIRGSVWLGAGALLLARNLGWLHFRIEAFWPLLMVFFGLHIIFKAREDPGEQLERRANKLRERQARWQRRAQRWQERHPGQTRGQSTPWAGHNFGGDWGAEWTKQWTEKWNEAQAKLQEDWHSKFHEKFDRPIDVDVQVDSPPATPVAPPTAGAPAGTTGGAQASAASATAYDSAGSTGSTGSAPYTGTGYASTSTGTADPYDTSRASSSYGQHKMSMFALMSGVTRRLRNTPFFGANMTAVMGGIELDLRQAHLPEDAVIELFAFWGGIEIWVPREWSVVNQGFALMGSIEDKTGNLPQRPGQPRLVLRGMALMGGVEIKN
jgi:hypothetical protein